MASGELLLETGKEKASSEEESVAADSLPSPFLPSTLVSMDAHANVSVLRDVPIKIPTAEESETTIEPTLNEVYSKIGMEEGDKEGEHFESHHSPRVSSFSFSPAPPFVSFPPVQENEKVESEALRQAQDRSIQEEEEGTGKTHWKAEEERNRPIETIIAVDEEQAEEEEDEEGSEGDPCDALVTEVSRLEAEKHIQGLLLAMAQRLAKSEEMALQECIIQQRHCTTSLEAALDARWKGDDRIVGPPQSVTGVPKPMPMGGIEGEGERKETNEKKGMTRVRTNASRQADASVSVGATSSSSSSLVPSTHLNVLAYLTAVEVGSLVDTQRKEKRWGRGGELIWREEEKDVATLNPERGVTKKPELAIGTAIKKRKTEKEGGEGHTSTEESPPCAPPDEEIDDIMTAHGRHWVRVLAPQLRREIAAVASMGGGTEEVNPSHLVGDTTHGTHDGEQQSQRESRSRFMAHIRALTEQIAADEGGTATGAVAGVVDAAEEAVAKAVDEGPRPTTALSLVSQWNAILQDALEVYATCMAMLQTTQHIRASAQHHWHTLCHELSSSPSALDTRSLSSSEALAQQAMSRWARRVDHLTDASLIEMVRWSEGNAKTREKRRALEVGVVTHVLSSLSSSCGSMGQKRLRGDASDLISDMKAHLQHEWEKASLSSSSSLSTADSHSREAATSFRRGQNGEEGPSPPWSIDGSPFSDWVSPISQLDAKLAYWSAMCRQLRYEVGVWCNGLHAVQASTITRSSKRGAEEKMEVLGWCVLPSVVHKEETSHTVVEKAREDQALLPQPSTCDAPALGGTGRRECEEEVSSFVVPSAMRGSCRPPLYALATTLHTLLHEWRVALYRHIFHSPPLLAESSSSSSLARLCTTLTSSAGPMAWQHLRSTPEIFHTAAENGAPNTTGRPTTFTLSSSSSIEPPSLPIPFSVTTPFSPSSLVSVSSFLPRQPCGTSMASIAEDTRDLPTVPRAVDPFPTEETGETQGQEKEEVEVEGGQLPSSPPPPPLSGEPLGCEALTFRRLQLLQMISSRQRMMEAVVQQNAFLYTWIRHAPPFVSLLTPPPPSSPFGNVPSETLCSTPADGKTTRWSHTTDAPSSSSDVLSGLVEEADTVWRRQEQHLSAYAAALEHLQTQFRQSFALPVHAAWEKAHSEREKMCYTLRRHVLAEHHHTQQLLSRAAAATTHAAPTADDASSKDSLALLMHSPYYREDVRALSNAIRAMRLSFPPTVTSSSKKEGRGGSGDLPSLPYPTLSFALPVLPASAQPLQTAYEDAWDRAESTILAPCVDSYRTLLTSLPRQFYAVRRWAAMVTSARKTTTPTTPQEWPLPATLRARLDAEKRRKGKKTSPPETTPTDGEEESDDGDSLQEIQQAAKDEVAELEQRLASLQAEAARRAKKAKDDKASRHAHRMALRVKLDELRQKVQDGRAELARRAEQTTQKEPPQEDEEETTATHKEASWTSRTVPVPANGDEKEAQDTNMGEVMDRVEGMREELENADGGDNEDAHLDEEGGEPLQDEDEEPQQDKEELALDEEGEPLQDEEEEPQQNEEEESRQAEEEELALDEEDPRQVDEEELLQDMEEEPQQDEEELALDEEGEPLQDEEEEPLEDEEEELRQDEEEPLQDEEEEPQQNEEEGPRQDDELQQDEEGKGNLPSATVTSSYGTDNAFHNPFASDW